MRGKFTLNSTSIDATVSATPGAYVLVNNSNNAVYYEEFYRRVHYWLVDSDLVADKDFHKDRKVLDVILNEDDPKSSQIKIAIDYCRKGQEYSLFFLKHLSNPKWLSHFDNGDLRVDPCIDSRIRGMRKRQRRIKY